MPTYEFRCPDGTIVERVFKMSEVPQTIPSPNGDGVAVRIISGGADLIFKGSGFYITDYKKSGGGGDSGKSSSSGSSDSSSSESKSSESKSTDSKSSDSKSSDTSSTPPAKKD